MRDDLDAVELDNPHHIGAAPMHDVLRVGAPAHHRGEQAISGGRDRQRAESQRQPITLTPFISRDPSKIPTRKHVYARHYTRKFVSVTVAPGGVGKSILTLAEAVAMAMGRNLLGHKSTERLRVWYWNGEDPPEETERRVHAICIHYGIDPGELEGWLFIDSGRNTPISIAAPEGRGFAVVKPVVDELLSAIRNNGVDVVIIDPFVKCHRVSENDNVAIDAVAEAWAAIADRTNCAVELVHHTRKTGGAEITSESSRGASSLVSASRSSRALNRMTAEDAEKFGVENHKFFFRADADKTNLAPPSDVSEWFQLHSISIGNGGGGPSDLVGVPTPWERPKPLDGLCVADLRKVQARLSNGTHGQSSQASDWAGYAIAEALEIDVSTTHGKARVKGLIKTWVENKALKVDKVADARNGRPRPIIIVGDAV